MVKTSSRSACQRMKAVRFQKPTASRTRSIEHQEGGDGERFLQIGLGVSGSGAPRGVELAYTGEDGDKVERDDTPAGDLPPAWRGLIILAGMKRNPAEAASAATPNSEVAKRVFRKAVSIDSRAREADEQAAETQRQRTDGEPAKDTVNAGRGGSDAGLERRAETQSSATPSASQPIVIQRPLAFRGIAMVRKTMASDRCTAEATLVSGSRIRPRYSAARRTTTHGSRS